MNKPIKAWMYKPNDGRYYANLVGQFAIYQDKNAAKRNATPNMLENAKLIPVLITPLEKATKKATRKVLKN